MTSCRGRRDRKFEVLSSEFEVPDTSIFRPPHPSRFSRKSREPRANNEMRFTRNTG